MKNLILVLPVVAVLASQSAGQTGACCVDGQCIDTMEQLKCLAHHGIWFEGENCEFGFDCPSQYPCGSYVLGDYNNNGEFNVADLIATRFVMIRPYPWLPCECPAGSGNVWFVRMDLNNDCAYNLADIIVGYSFLFTGSPQPLPCELCPPFPGG